MKNTEHLKIIEDIGGTGVTASVCEVSSQAVSKWKRTGIPKARLMFLREKFPKIFNFNKTKSMTGKRARNDKP